MKLIGSYTSPFVRKISVILLEKAIPFEFVNEFPYHETNGVAQYNPLGKVPRWSPTTVNAGTTRPLLRNIWSCSASRRICCLRRRRLR
jgi:hypothetical protein